MYCIYQLVRSCLPPKLLLITLHNFSQLGKVLGYMCSSLSTPLKCMIMQFYSGDFILAEPPFTDHIRRLNSFNKLQHFVQCLLPCPISARTSLTPRNAVRALSTPFNFLCSTLEPHCSHRPFQTFQIKRSRVQLRALGASRCSSARWADRQTDARTHSSV